MIYYHKNNNHIIVTTWQQHFSDPFLCLKPFFVPWFFEEVDEVVFEVWWSFWTDSCTRHCTKWHLFDLSTVGELCLAKAAVVMPVDSRDIWLTECVWLFFGLSAFKLQTTVPVEVVLVVEDNDDSVESVA